MTRTEITILAITGAMVLGMVFLVNSVGNQIQDAGGFRQIVIDAGKELKDIIAEIEKE